MPVDITGVLASMQFLFRSLSHLGHLGAASSIVGGIPGGTWACITGAGGVFILLLVCISVLRTPALPSTFTVGENNRGLASP